MAESENERKGERMREKPYERLVRGERKVNKKEKKIAFLSV